MINRFIWKGGKKTSGYHLANWQSLAKPKEAGGWGIKHLEWFALALAAKTCWRGLFGNNLWNKVITRKYLKGIDTTSWLRRDFHHTKTPSIFWQNLMLALPMIKRSLAWKVGTGQRVILGRDPYIGCEGSNVQLSNALLQHLHSHGIYSLAQARNKDTTDPLQSWLSARSLGLNIELSQEWEAYTKELILSGIRLNKEKDFLHWS